MKLELHLSSPTPNAWYNRVKAVQTKLNFNRELIGEMRKNTSPGRSTSKVFTYLSLCFSLLAMVAMVAIPSAASAAGTKSKAATATSSSSPATTKAVAENAALNGGTFGAVPLSAGSAIGRSYFNYTLRAGATKKDVILLSNAAHHPVTVKISASQGRTATNSGYFYTGGFKKCQGTACWITGLPATVTIPARTTKENLAHVQVPFTVLVPASATPKQYLAGITIEPNKLPNATKVAQKGKVGVEALIIHQVNIGLAVTVGNIATLPKKMVIPSVTSTLIGSLPRLNVHVHNIGKTFLAGAGNTVCSPPSGKKVSSKFGSNIVLPAEKATLAVNEQGLKLGSVDYCVVKINYGGATDAVWRGRVHISSNVLKYYHKPGTPNGEEQLVPGPSVPTWAYIAGGILLAIILGLLFFLLAAKRRKKVECQNCHHMNDKDQKFCSKCGNPLSQENVDAPEETPESQA